MTDNVAGMLVVQAYYASCWEASRTLMNEMQEQTGVSLGYPIPAWGELSLEVQMAVINRGQDLLDDWDRIVAATSEHHHTGGHS